ncbi:MAG: LysR family transcriptional regulator [Lactobacillus sp.]|jgi:DNA-binding transcriptional LysR family regulator|nr:LysR family transcriptional regulator [Lactobacillus sp.]
MEIRVLRYFLAVAAEQNISRAAQQLHVSQPTISRQLQDLEQELGVTLFDRQQLPLKLTAAGQYLVNQATQIVALADKTTANIHHNPDITGSIAIGCGESKHMLLIAQTIKQLQTTYPQIKINITSTNADDIHAKIQTNIFDFGLVMEPVDKSNYAFMTLPTTSQWGVLALKDSKLGQQAFITPKDLLDIPLIMSQQSGVIDILQTWAGQAFEPTAIVATYNLLYNASLLVTAKVGYALCVDGIINTQQTNLKFIPLKPDLRSKVSLIWLQQQHRSEAANAFLKQVKSDFA